MSDSQKGVKMLKINYIAKDRMGVGGIDMAG